jgi:hypothetical protein
VGKCWVSERGRLMKCGRIVWRSGFHFHLSHIYQRNSLNPSQTPDYYSISRIAEVRGGPDRKARIWDFQTSNLIENIQCGMVGYDERATRLPACDPTCLLGVGHQVVRPALIPSLPRNPGSSSKPNNPGYQKEMRCNSML